MKLFSKKPIEVLLAQASEEGEHTLKRGLGAFSLTALGIGSIIAAVWSQAPFTVNDAHELIRTGAVLNLPAVFIIGLTTTVLILGITESAAFNNIVVAIKVAVVLLVIVFGFMHVNPQYWHPFV